MQTQPGTLRSPALSVDGDGDGDVLLLSRADRTSSWRCQDTDTSCLAGVGLLFVPGSPLAAAHPAGGRGLGGEWKIQNKNGLSETRISTPKSSQPAAVSRPPARGSKTGAAVGTLIPPWLLLG